MKKLVMLVAAAYLLVLVAMIVPAIGAYVQALPGLLAIIALYLRSRSRRDPDGSRIARMRRAAYAYRWNRMTLEEASRHYRVSEKAIRRFNHFSWLYLE